MKQRSGGTGRTHGSPANPARRPTQTAEVELSRAVQIFVHSQKPETAARFLQENEEMFLSGLAQNFARKERVETVSLQMRTLRDKGGARLGEPQRSPLTMNT